MTMETLQLREEFYWTGIVDDQLRVFDIIMYTEFGTTYNSYILKAGDKTVLFETAKAKFFDEYLEKLSEITDIRKIDYLVVNHTEPDHAGSVERLLELNPGLKIIATGCAIGFLKEIVNGEFTAIPVKDNETMKIGNKTLRFLSVPNLHWPDTMYTDGQDAAVFRLGNHPRENPQVLRQGDPLLLRNRDRKLQGGAGDLPHRRNDLCRPRLAERHPDRA